jgi:allophanate hydrolase
MCQLCYARTSAMQRRSFIALAGAAAAAPALAQVDVGAPSRARGLVPADEIEAASAQQYSQMMAEARQQKALAPENYPQLQRLRAIAARLIPQSLRWNERAKAWRWEVNLIGSKQINAFCMPGGKIAFYTGLLDQLQLSDDEAAMVMGHEMAHALREHARARIAKEQGHRRVAAAGRAVVRPGPVGRRRREHRHPADLAALLARGRDRGRPGGPGARRPRRLRAGRGGVAVGEDGQGIGRQPGPGVPVDAPQRPGPENGSPAAAWIAKFATPLRGVQANDALGAVLPLAGLRFAVKDNIDVAGVPTTAACPAFDRLPIAHAAVVQRLLDAGASLVGKTNLDQFACGLNGTRSPYGEVPNAFDARYVSGGSSSGSAYAVAAGEVDFALGTDTAGSGRVPAGLNNIVGLKPSRGLLSTFGVVPAAQSADCVSIFARTVALAVDVLLATAGHDARDPYSRDLALRCEPLPARFRFGVPDTLAFFGDSAAEQAFAEAQAKLVALGGSPVTIAYAPLAEAAALLYESALVAERYAAVRTFFDAHGDDVIEPVRSILASGRNYTAADVFDAQTCLRAIAQQVAPMWRGIDVLLVPTAPTHYSREQMRADPVVCNRNLGAYTNFVNLLDYAALSVPSSLRADGLPFGITLIGPCGSDLALAELGQRYHHATGLAQGATGLPLPAPRPVPAWPRRRPTRCPSWWSARISRACRSTASSPSAAPRCCAP